MIIPVRSCHPRDADCEKRTMYSWCGIPRTLKWEYTNDYVPWDDTIWWLAWGRTDRG